MSNTKEDLRATQSFLNAVAATGYNDKLINEAIACINFRLEDLSLELVSAAMENVTDKLWNRQTVLNRINWAVKAYNNRVVDKPLACQNCGEFWLGVP